MRSLLPGLVAGAATGLCVLLLGRPRARLSPRALAVPGWVLLVPLPLVLLLARAWLVPAAVVLLAAVGAHRLWRQRRRARAADAAGVRVLEACEAMAGDLRAGQPPARVLARAAAAWPALAPAAEAERLGGSVPGALRAAARVEGAGDLWVVAAAWEVSGRTGQGLAAALESVRRSVRADHATRRVVAGELASARATARLVAVLPVLALLMGSGAGGDPVGFLLGTVAGWVCLAAGVGLGLVGLGWIEAIARGVVES